MNDGKTTDWNERNRIVENNLRTVSIATFGKGFVTELDTRPSEHSLNIDFYEDGVIRPRKSWATFAGMVWQLWLINKRLTKLGLKAEYTVTLPLKSGGYKHGKKRKDEVKHNE